MLFWTIAGVILAGLAALLSLLAYLRANARRRIRDEREVVAYTTLEPIALEALLIARRVLDERGENATTVANLRGILIRLGGTISRLAGEFRPRRAKPLLKRLHGLTRWTDLLKDLREAKSALRVAEESVPALQRAYRLIKRRAR